MTEGSVDLKTSVFEWCAVSDSETCCYVTVSLATAALVMITDWTNTSEVMSVGTCEVSVVSVFVFVYVSADGNCSLWDSRRLVEVTTDGDVSEFVTSVVLTSVKAYCDWSSDESDM